MRLSRQRLEDNPANYDGQFAPPPSSSSTAPTASTSFKPWKIYPPPPSPHWKERDPYAEATETTEEIAEREARRREFHFDEVEIPGLELVGKKKRFELDGNGVFQVYAEGEFERFQFGMWKLTRATTQTKSRTSRVTRFLRSRSTFRISTRS